MSKRIEECVCRHVICLSGISHHRCGGGKEDKEVKRRGCSYRVKVPCAKSLGLHDAFEPIGVELQQDAVIQNHCGMHNPT